MLKKKANLKEKSTHDLFESLHTKKEKTFRSKETPKGKKLGEENTVSQPKVHTRALKGVQKLGGFLTKAPKETKQLEEVLLEEKVTPQKASVIVPKRTAPVESDIPSAPVTATPPKMRVPEFGAKKGFFDTFGLGKERDHFIENLSMLVLSGMPIMSALSSITNDTRSPKMKAVLQTILGELESGSPLWKSFDRTGLFKGYTISLIRIGEESGKFAENLKVVSLENEKERNLRSKVKSALMYPAFVLVLTAVIGISISWFILPKLAKIFSDLKLDLPLITKVLIGFGLFLQKNGLWVVPLGVLVVSLIVYVLFINNKTKFLGESILYSIPGINTLLTEVEVARFGYLLGTLLDAGLPVTKAIDSLASASESVRYKRFYLYLKDSIELGNSFQKSFYAHKTVDKLIPRPMQQLVFSGEQSGNLNKTLLKIGQVLEEKSDTTTKNLTIIMEPILLVIVWVGVVSVAFAVILPIYSLVGGLNKA